MGELRGWRQTYFYPVGANQGFVMDFTTAAVAPAASSRRRGQRLIRTVQCYDAGRRNAAVASAGRDYLAASFNASGTGSVSGTAGVKTNGTLVPDAAIAGSDTVAASGRASLTALDSGNAVLYVISPNKGVVLDLSAAAPLVVELVHQ